MMSRFARLTAADMLNLAVETPNNPMNMGAVIVVDAQNLCDDEGSLRLTHIRQMMERRLAELPQLRRTVYEPSLLAGRPLWINDPTFRIERHIKQVALPAPGNEEALLRLACDLMVPLLDRKRPLWRIWLVTGMSSGKLAIVVKLHHVIGDGLAALQLMTALSDAAEAHPEPATRPESETPPPWRDLVADNLRSKSGLARRLHPRRIAGSAGGIWRMVNQSWNAPRTTLNKPVGPRRKLALLRMDLAAAKQVSHEHGGKVNDVVLAVAAAGLRGLLISRGERIRRMQLHAAVAVSLRSDQNAAAGGNHTGTYMVRLPLGEPDTATRLDQIAADSMQAKQKQHNTAGNALMAQLARLGLVRTFSRHQHLINLIESNLAGPPAPIRFLGAPVLELIPVGNLAGNLSIAFLALSYNGRITLTVQVDADQYPDLPVLTDAMQHDWALLLRSSRRLLVTDAPARTRAVLP